ncbi:C69 family dipeptidase [Salmonella enterica subsp. enterica]|nr:C69 family dipeptidase [Salmonella enterica subsp. enterica]
MRYTAIHDFDTNDNAMGEAGFTPAGVGMSATETIYNGRAALAADPYVTKQESREDAIESVILPGGAPARQGAKLLGDIIEQKARAKLPGVAFIDSKEIWWYLETGSGHQWLAVRLPADSAIISFPPIRTFTTTIRMITRELYGVTSTLVKCFAKKQGLYDPARGEFADLHRFHSAG